MTKRLKAGVVGVGNMGRHHARILAAMPDVELACVVDEDPVQATAVAARFGCTSCSCLEDAPELDVAVVAVPTIHHTHVATQLMERGTSVLVEKPLAGSSTEAEALVRVAARNGVMLSTGHIERFNSAVSALLGIVDDPVFLQFQRLSPYTPRISESVVFDLMVHDLDLVAAIAGSPVVRVEAVGTCVLSESLDVASALLEFGNGCLASLQASRVTQDKVRRIAVSERERFIEVDCVRQDVSMKRETTVEFADDESVYRQASVVEIPYLDRRSEPLHLELSNFIDAVLGREALLVDGMAGLGAVRMAEAVQASAMGDGVGEEKISA